MKIEAIFGRAVSLAAGGDDEGALRAFSEICRHWPDLAVGHANRATVLRRLGRLVEAMDAASMAARLEPGEPGRWAQLGGIAHDAGSMGHAASAFHRQLCLVPGDGEALFNLAVALPLIGRREAAVRVWRHLSVVAPDNAGAWLRLARTERRLGLPGERVVRLVRRAQLLEPDDKEIAAALAVLDGGAAAAGRWACLDPGDDLAIEACFADGKGSAAASGRGRRLVVERITHARSRGETPSDPVLRLAHGLGLATDLATRYQTWLDRHHAVDREAWRAEIAGWRDPPVIDIVLPVCDPPADILEETLASVTGQLYPHWRLCIVDDASRDPAVRAVLQRAAEAEPRVILRRRERGGHISRASNDALALSDSPFVGFLDHDDLLAPDALAWVVRCLIERPDLDLVYSDEDKIDARGARFDPHFKPDWDPDRAVTQNYPCHFSVYRRRLIERVGGLRVGLEGAQDHDLMLRVSRLTTPERIHHIPRILYHWRVIAGSTAGAVEAKPYAIAAGHRAAADHLARSGGGNGGGGRLIRDWPRRRLVRALPAPPPLVSVIVPTRDRAALLAHAVDGVLTGSDYPTVEVIVVDNGSVEPETDAYLAAISADPRVRVLNRPGPFNFSALMNDGVAEARGEILLFLNNDVEPMDPGWIRELASQAARPEIGAVGALLLYPDRTVQHAGVALAGDWVARHVGVGERDGAGYHARLLAVQRVSAVTGACLAIRRTVFDAVGGFDAEHLRVDFSDIDLCLKAAAAGYATLFTPYARLIHHESATRGGYMSAEKRPRWEAEAAVMRARWGSVLDRDPYYSPNLAVLPGQKPFDLAEPPRFRHRPGDPARRLS